MLPCYYLLLFDQYALPVLAFIKNLLSQIHIPDWRCTFKINSHNLLATLIRIY